MAQELTHFIGGEHVKGTSGRFSDVFNPATGEVQAKCPLASKEEVRKALRRYINKTLDRRPVVVPVVMEM